MSVTSQILQILLDGGKDMDDAILVAQAMERGDDARRMFDMVDMLEAQDRTDEDRATVILIYAQALIKESARSRSSGGYAPQPNGPKDRWGYEGPITPRLPEREWWPLRAKVLQRDNHTCFYCEEQAERMCVDHVIPLSRGGTNEEDNLVACCIPCNSSKCDRLLDEWEGRVTV